MEAFFYLRHTFMDTTELVDDTNTGYFSLDMEHKDIDTGLVYLQSRMYNTRLKVFMSKDRFFLNNK